MPRFLWALVSLAALSGCGRSTDRGAEWSYFEPAILPCGIADEAGTTGFFVNPKGGLDAVHLESGKLLWQTSTPFEPLITRAGWLFVLERTGPKRARVVALNALDKGREVWTSVPIDLSEPDRLRRPDHVQEIRRSKARIQPGQLHLWLALDYAMAARIDLGSGKVHILPDEQTSPFWGLSTENFSEIAKLAGDSNDGGGLAAALPRRPERKLEEPKRGELWLPKSKFGENKYAAWDRWVVGDTLALVLTKSWLVRSQERFFISWDLKTGKNLHTVQLGPTGYSFVAFHGRYLVDYPLREQRGLKEPEGPQKYSPVRIFSVETAKWTHEIALEADAKHPWPAGMRLFYVIEGKPQGTGPDAWVPRTLKAMDMDSRKVLWERVVSGRPLPDPGPRLWSWANIRPKPGQEP